MEGLPVTIRLLDPPLHEFLPRAKDEIAALARVLNLPLDKVEARVAELQEFNPMLGFRGCRLGILYPEITETQARAIFEATLAAEDATGIAPKVEIMVPLVAWRGEFDLVAKIIRRVAGEIERQKGRKIAYEIGTMVELPRAVLKADEIAAGAEGAAFFSFGTNDLTQTTLGISRDDAAPILAAYAQQAVFETDPFVSIDVSGVGELVRIGTERGRRVKPDLKIGICGEHGGDPASVYFCHAAGLDYVSCSAHRVPVARLAAAHAAIRERLEQKA
jgi:pyruvate,orthophosphate dikinase